jgi:hypothetical protein
MTHKKSSLIEKRLGEGKRRWQNWRKLWQKRRSEKIQQELAWETETGDNAGKGGILTLFTPFFCINKY